MRLSKVLRVGAWGLAGVVLQAGAVAAATAPKIGPPAAWVLPAPALAPEADALKSLPVAILLNDTQLSFDADGWTEYREIVGKVQAADGLQAVGAVPFVWYPRTASSASCGARPGSNRR